MRLAWIYIVLLLFTDGSGVRAQFLKSIVYDFDGLTKGQADLPEGDYQVGDLSHSISENPLASSDMIGDRVLKLQLNWQTGRGLFGRGISRYIEFDPAADRLNFFFYNPSANNQAAEVTVMITDDDDGSKNFNLFSDDCWTKKVTLSASESWQFISLPLNEFADDNGGGNGIMDLAFTQNKGMLLQLEFQFDRPADAGHATFYLDMISFSEGTLPHGASFLDLPASAGGKCPLGAYMKQGRGQEHLIASQFESLFPPGPAKKIKFVNYFLLWSSDGGTVANDLPGNEITQLLAGGYRPVITWEPMFQHYSRLDPVQPRLQNILNGDYDTYIDQVADRVKSFADTVVIRFMHEFEGDWYPWSICMNGSDPAKYVQTFRKVVDRFRARGVTNVQWMWCVNSDYAPYEYYNWFVQAYPGDAYVDMVATDIYNNHFPVELPWWKSFRIQTAESYYYLSKYFPNKPLYICEVGCRERLSTESTSSESKGAWYARMDKELQSNFQKVRALIFFNAAPDQNWLVNSSPSALQSLTEHVWNDDYYFELPVGMSDLSATEPGLFVFPNPTNGAVAVKYTGELLHSAFVIRIYNSLGEVLYEEEVLPAGGVFMKSFNFSSYPKGIYFVDLSAGGKGFETKKIIYQ